MSLATRCTACGTVFRVVQDQLKVSEGWVRCGRCNEVFSALEGLFDLDRDTPSAWQALGSNQAEVLASSLAAAPPTTNPEWTGHEPDSGGDEHSLIDKIDAQLMNPRETGPGSTPAARIRERDRLEFPDAQFDSDMMEDSVIVEPTAPATPLESRNEAELMAASAAPDFVLRHPGRGSRSQDRWARVVRGFVIVLLMAALALQGARHFRDTIAAQWPATAPLLSAWCGAAACVLEPPKRIDEVTVESTALTRVPAQDAFRLSVVLRNRATTAVLLPSIDLTLTDANGQLVARRMLAPREFQLASALMAPGAESSMQLLLTAGSAKVTGYTVEAFYP